MPRQLKWQAMTALPNLLLLVILTVFAIIYIGSAQPPTMNVISETFSSLVKSNKNDISGDGSNQWHYDYSTVTGFFLQDSTRTNPGTFDAMKENFGLIEQEYDTDRLLPANGKDLTQWQRFAFKLKKMNERAVQDVSYRLLYLGRHGQGYHNVGSSFYGDDAWDCYFSAFNKDPTVPKVVFYDAHLTLLGEYQARLASQFWQRMITEQKIPVPQSYYSSPLSRACQTAELTFANLSLPSEAPFRPVIKEMLREGYGIHTCDSRPSRSYLRSNFSSFDIEDSFTETDELASPNRREPPLTLIARMAGLLDDVITHDQSTYISMTCHHGTIASTLRAVGHRSFKIPTGSVIPVLIKVSKSSGPRPDNGSKQEQWELKPGCRADPTLAGKPGYTNIGEYVKEIEKEVPKDDLVDGLKRTEIARKLASSNQL